MAYGLAVWHVTSRNSIIIAGHQRTKAARQLGRKTVPVYYTHASERGEMIINQIHNALEDNDGSVQISVPPCEEVGFVNVPAKEIEYFGKQTNFSNKYGVQLLTYGNIDAGVATADGQVIKNVDYVVACHGLRCPARIYYLPKEADTELKSKTERREAFSGKQVGFTTAMPDKDGVTETMGNHGEWFFQKFHSRDQLRSLCNRYGMEIVSFAPNSKVIAYCTKTADLPVEDVKESIFNEFNMFYSDTERYDHAEKVWTALENCYN